MLFINLIIILTLLGIGIYGFVLFVKLANRGIKALDIYINLFSRIIRNAATTVGKPLSPIALSSFS